MAPVPEARIKLDAYTVEAVCEHLCEGKPLTWIAKDAGVAIGSLLTWIEGDVDRSARVRDVRAAMARYWDEKSERCIEEAADEFELKKAKELSHHYRWRASKIAPREYGDKVQTDSTVTHRFEDATEDELKARALVLAGKIGG